MTEIQAAVLNAFGAPFEIETLHLAAPRAGEIEVAVEAVAICHSDIAYAEGGYGGKPPLVLGHEAAGRVVALGDGVTDLEIGQRVVITLIRACGTCATCAGGRPTLCQTPARHLTPLSRPDGTPVMAEMDCGAFATGVVIGRNQCVPVPDSMPGEVAALLGCGVITGVGGVIHAGRLRPGEDVVVIGAGGVGLNAIQGARIAGARRIVAVDMSEDKLEIARAFGATDGVLASDAKPWRRAMRALGRGADLCVVTVGAIPAYEAAPRYLGYGGRMVMVGMPHSGQKASYEPVIAAFTGQSMIGSKMGDVVIARDIPWMADLWAQGRLKLDELISGRWSLGQINEAVADTKTGAARRNVILL
ncbi:S-(hydroxymethyl)mycothiol dehydrogenase [Roseivivax sp. THAF40]|uniref:alcohol dehydrogenase catalytic domain-containing protein n=1 Tax=unclassified Roseivivax TaxID=2639302 RepID=UPI0012693632|nr:MULTISPECIES: zinc-binding dehydrogenase [unclassified Roseivivax]QFS83795.1 S-(hydroxymethyl)mycothiol dehydrogenase [Roseivivax sp. THAF197b]QFT47627.1 S-(hydroxymethyl)mycothiol dehydrogenase [Roseivivax sp. THAF40]